MLLKLENKFPAAALYLPYTALDIQVWKSVYLAEATTIYIVYLLIYSYL